MEVSMRKRAYITALLCLCLGVSAVAQTQFGVVTGRVSDTTGALISLAQVTLTNTATNIRQETKTNPDGTFIIANVRAGNYEISVENQGFRKVVRQITVGVAQRLKLDFFIRLAAFQMFWTRSVEGARSNTPTADSCAPSA